MFNYDAEKNIFSVSFDMDVLGENVATAIDEVIENFFGETAIRSMYSDDYDAMFNKILDYVKR